MRGRQTEGVNHGFIIIRQYMTADVVVFVRIFSVAQSSGEKTLSQGTL
jgi:hypothetical protein